MVWRSTPLKQHGAVNPTGVEYRITINIKNSILEYRSSCETCSQFKGKSVLICHHHYFFFIINQPSLESCSSRCGRQRAPGPRIQTLRQRLFFPSIQHGILGKNFHMEPTMDGWVTNKVKLGLLSVSSSINGDIVDHQSHLWSSGSIPLLLAQTATYWWCGVK